MQGRMRWSSMTFNHNHTLLSCNASRWCNNCRQERKPQPHPITLLPSKTRYLQSMNIHDCQYTNGWTDGRTYGRMDGRKISPFYRISSPTGAAAQKPQKEHQAVVSEGCPDLSQCTSAFGGVNSCFTEPPVSRNSALCTV